MNYLIIIYSEDDEQLLKRVSEEEVFKYIENNASKAKFAIYKIECICDLS